jgi:Fic family protein
VSDLEAFLHDRDVRTSALIKAAVAQVQFETIHPFLDGNGRLGRLLVTLLLCAEGAQAEPILYLRLYLKKHRDAYYDLLQSVREASAWEAWLEFFLTGVHETAQQAFAAVQSLVAMFRQDRSRIEELGRSAGSALQVHGYLQRRVFLSIPEAQRSLPISVPTIQKSIDALEEMGVVREVTGKARNRIWVYQEYLDTLSEES